MEHDQHIDHIERELTTVLELLAEAPPDAPVPTCPGFDVAALDSHLAEVCGFWAHVLASALGRPADDLPDGLAGRGVLLVGHLRDSDAATPAWSWFEPDQTAAFASRRLCHELTIHRVDLQAAVSTVEPIPVDVAHDGIEEFLLLAGSREQREPGASGSIHLHGTDEAAEWLLTMTADALAVERHHAKGDVAVRGAVSDLELLVYGRPTVGEVQTFGEVQLLERFRDRYAF